MVSRNAAADEETEVPVDPTVRLRIDIDSTGDNSK
jgi:hypothetical protein